MAFKDKIYSIYYTAQTGYGALGWLFSLVSYGAIILVTLKLNFPGVSGTEVAIIGAFFVFLFLEVFGHYFLKGGGFKASQSFGKRNNPNAMMWELEVIKGRITAEECKIISQMAEKLNIDTTKLNKEVLDLKDIQKSMDELLGIKTS